MYLEDMEEFQLGHLLTEYHWAIWLMFHMHSGNENTCISHSYSQNSECYRKQYSCLPYCCGIEKSMEQSHSSMFTVSKWFMLAAGRCFLLKTRVFFFFSKLPFTQIHAICKFLPSSSLCLSKNLFSIKSLFYPAACFTTGVSLVVEIRNDCCKKGRDVANGRW